MDLYLLAELKTISLKITTVDMKRPPPDFRSNFEAAQPPILIDGGEELSRKNIFVYFSLFLWDIVRCQLLDFFSVFLLARYVWEVNVKFEEGGEVAKKKESIRQ